MTYNSDTIKNSVVLDYFNYLQAKNLEPTVAIWRGKLIMITSYKANTVPGKIYQIFLKVKTSIFHFFKLLENNQNKVAEIKADVAGFHLEKCNLSQEFRTFQRMNKLYEKESEKTADILKNAYGLIFDDTCGLRFATTEEI